MNRRPRFIVIMIFGVAGKCVDVIVAVGNDCHIIGRRGGGPDSWQFSLFRRMLRVSRSRILHH